MMKFIRNIYKALKTEHFNSPEEEIKGSQYLVNTSMLITAINILIILLNIVVLGIRLR